MGTSTSLGFWMERVVFAIVTLALLAATVYATLSTSATAPAVRWVRVLGEQMLTSFVG